MPKTFVHLTDLHISNPDVEEPHLYSDTAAILRDALARIDALPDRPEFIIVSGDLTNNEDPVAYQRLHAIWDGVDIPTLFALGNHDSRPDFRREMLGESTDLDAPYDHEAVVAGVHVIVLDSSTPDQIHGTLEDAQLEWLTAALDRHAELPKIVVLHHPPMMGADEPAFECLAPEDTEKLRKVLIGLPLLGLFCGHIHQDRVSIWNGIPVFVGNGHHSRMQPFSDMAIEATDGTGFSVCTLRDSGLTVNFLPQPSEGRTVMAMTKEDAARLMSEPAAEVVG